MEVSRRRRSPRSGKSLYALAKDLEGKTDAWWNELDPIKRQALHREAQKALDLLMAEARRRAK